MLTTDWAKQETQLMTTGPEGVAIMKGPVISILTNIGSPVRASKASLLYFVSFDICTY